MPLAGPNLVSHSGAARAAGGLRQVVESLTLLAVAVTLFRSFAAEGYLISTGSMAPSLLGYHRRVICPACRFQFARGAAFENETSTSQTAQANLDFHDPSAPATECPNCGLADIPAHLIPRNEGDQLLVHKHVYDFRPPRRWEVVVFRNPGDARQAYVKRIVGLPGERIELIDGEVVTDGLLRRKPFPVQEAMRIPVAAYGCSPRENDPDWQPRWQTPREDSRWSLEPDRLTFDGWTQSGNAAIDWIEYRHWIRTGGRHLTSVPLAEWPGHLELPQPEYSRLQHEAGRLLCQGVFSDLERSRWLTRDDSPAFHQAINSLFVQSHLAPITDRYGYNAGDHAEEHLVRDLMVALDLVSVRGTGRFEIELTDGERTFRAVFNFAEHCVELLMNDDPVPVRQVKLNGRLFDGSVRIDFSLFDQQAVLAINRQPIFPAVEFDVKQPTAGIARPARVGAVGIQCEVQGLQLFRDVYYTRKADSSEPIVLGEDQYYVLGDNSPISVDSRAWTKPAISREAFIGKPVVVHLPSRQGRIEWGGKEHNVRIPDLSRVRYVR